MPAVALTDHGCSPARSSSTARPRKHGVKPLLGCEVYVADDRRAQKKGYAHLTLLAETNEGYGEPDQALLASATSRATTTSRASTGSCSSATRRA